MRSSTFAATAALLGAAGLVHAQTFTDCDPTKKTCPANPGIGTTFTTDFTKGITSDWTLAAGTSMSYDGTLGANFVIQNKTNAPVVLTNKYIMFGHVTAVMRAAPGVGTVSSFILESDDLDEIDWEWLGSTDNSVESNFFGKGDTSTYDRAAYHDVSTPIEDFHKYEIDWTADRIVWSIDGTPTRTLTYDDPLTHGGSRYPQTPMKVRMGNWIGCLDINDPKTKGTCEWAGGQIDLTKGPFSMYVQSVTVQDYGCGGDYTYSDMTGSYQSIKSSGTCDGKGSSNSSSATHSASSTVSAQSTVSTLSSVSSGTASAAAPTVSPPTGVVGSATTTLSTAASTGTGRASSSGTATASSTLATSTSAASSFKPKRQFGFVESAVAVLGVGLGFLFM